MIKTSKAKASGRPTKAAETTRKNSRNRQSLESKLSELKRRLLEISDLNAAGAVLSWDQATYMPKGGADSRGRQGAVLRKLAHEKSIDPELGRLLDELEP